MNWINPKKYKNSGNGEEEEQYQYVQESASSAIRVVENKIFFYETITNNSVLELNKTLMELDSSLQHTKTVLGVESEPIIKLHIKTDGGDIYSAISTIEVMSQIKSHVHTFIEGCVSSAGTLIAVAGDKRFIGKHSYILIHQLSGRMYGKFSEMEDAMYNSTKLMKFIKDQYKQHTKLPMKKLDELLQKDIILDAKECLEFGIVDQIL
jgi:ATP-dependent Clp endopeptidase proteolytic subunit ClpP